ncbi:retrovirus-related pol polyprotein from transposon 17.6 [Tanacetum coccineum]
MYLYFLVIKLTSFESLCGYVANKRVNFRALINKEQVANNDTVLPKAAMEDVKSRYDNTLIGYFVGKSLAFTIVQNYVNNTWAKFGLSKLMKMDNGWTPNVSLKPGVVTKVPVWVKLYNVPVVAYSKDGLSLIATQIRKPIMLDAFTSSMCVDSWGRISFARALIEIDANSDLKKEVKMAIPIDEDDGSAQNNDAFTEVVSRKNKGKKVVNQQPKNPIAGLRFHKPKSTFYRPINKKNNDKQDKKKPDDVKASSSHACSDKSTPISNAFSVLNSEEVAECGDPFPTNDAGSAQNDGGVQNPSLGTEEAIVECEKDSLWSKFKSAKEASKSNPRSTSDFKEESNKDEVYFPNEEYTSGMGGGFSLEEDDLDCYDGYEAQVFDMPGYDIRLNSRRRK